MMEHGGLHRRGQAIEPVEPAPALLQRAAPSGQSSLDYGRSFLLFYNRRYAWSDTLVDCLTIAGMGTRFARGYNKMAATEIAIFSAYITAVLAHMLWRWLLPRSYFRWRHVSCTAFTLLATCTPRFWRRRVLGLHRPFNPPVAGPLSQAAIAARVVLVNSYTLQLLVYGMSRPVPLWLKLPTHAASTAVAVSNVGGLCATPVFRNPAVMHWLQRVYRGCRSLAELLPLPASRLLPEAGEAGMCRTVVAFVLVALGFALPMMVATTVELQARQHHSQLQPSYRHHWRRQKRRPWWRLAAWLTSGRRWFHNWLGDLAALLVVAAALWDIVLAVTGSAALSGGGTT